AGRARPAHRPRGVRGVHAVVGGRAAPLCGTRARGCPLSTRGAPRRRGRGGRRARRQRRTRRTGGVRRTRRARRTPRGGAGGGGPAAGRGPGGEARGPRPEEGPPVPPEPAPGRTRFSPVQSWSATLVTGMAPVLKRGSTPRWIASRIRETAEAERGRFAGA